MPFRTKDGIVVPAVTADQMREVDRIADRPFFRATLREGLLGATGCGGIDC
jgi:hypothetical protein